MSSGFRERFLLKALVDLLVSPPFILSHAVAAYQDADMMIRKAAPSGEDGVHTDMETVHFAVVKQSNESPPTLDWGFLPLVL